MDWYKKYKYAQNEMTFEESISEVNNCNEAIAVFNQYKVPYRKITWPGGAAPVYVYGSMVMECDASGVSFSDANNWVYDLNDFNLDAYIPVPDFGETFWQNVSAGEKLYHGTDSENVPSILQYGINAASKTRGLSNRGTGDAVFTSSNPEGTRSYGDAVIEIDVAAMKAAGITPRVSQEDPFEGDNQRKAIAWRLGLKEFVGVERDWEGMSEETIVIHGSVPPQFLRQVS